MYKLILLFVLLFLLKGNYVEAQKRPNIIFILSDDHSVPYLGCYKNKDVKTPNIDRLAKEGIRFNEAFVTAPQCTPSRASLMTGRSPVDIQMTRFAAPLPKEVTTFPEQLKKAGYYTGIVGRYFHLDGPYNFVSETESFYKEKKLETFNQRVDDLKIGDNNTANKQFSDFLNKVPKSNPFFIQVSYEDPHYPFATKEFEPDPASLALPKGMPDIPEVRHYLSRHIGAIQRLDSLVGILLNEIDARGLKSNTVVVFMGDNGAALLRGKGTLYDAGLHVPLLVRWPEKIKAGLVSSTLISGEDIAPTFLDIAGVKTFSFLTGKSFKQSFTDVNYESHDFIFAERGTHSNTPSQSTADFDLIRAVFNKKYKLIYNALWQLPYTPIDFDQDTLWRKLVLLHKENKLDTLTEKLFFLPTRPVFELYDLVNDPDELVNLQGVEDYSKIEKELKIRLQEWMIEFHDFVPLILEPVKKNNDKL